MATISVRQAAKRLGVSASLVYLWCQEKRLSHLRLGQDGRRGKILIDEADIEAFLAASRVEAGAGGDPSPTLRHISLK